MPRKPRYDYPGATHHVFNRGATKAPVFLDEKDRRAFIDGLAHVAGRFGVRVQAYALMTTHYHLAMMVPRGNLSDAMRYLLGRYGRRFNDRHGRDGSPFRGRFANRLVETEDYRRNLYAYVHLNPVRAGMAENALAAAWTSHAASVGQAPCPAWLDCSWVEPVYGGRSAFQFFVDEASLLARPLELTESCPPPDTDVLTTPGALVVRATPVAAALAIAAHIAGVPRPSILRARGHAGELAAWTLAALAGLNQREIAAILRISPPAAGQRIRRFEAWYRSDVEGRAWYEAATGQRTPARAVGV